MESFQWDQCFVTGQAMVDEQHHYLVDLINQFGRQLRQPEGASEQEILQLFQELFRYTQYHFAEEEDLMVRSWDDMRHTAHHKAEHSQFLQDVQSMHEGMSSGNAETAKELLQFLSNWLAYHILGSDQLMACLMEAATAGTSQRDAFDAFKKGRDPATATLLQAIQGLFEQISDRNRKLVNLNKTLELRVAERTQKLEAMAMTDALTGIPNRRQALLSLHREWLIAERHKTPLACMMIDTDSFKAINDTYGHDAGDEVLRQLSQRLRDSVRADDIVCRLGGDEFLIICARTPVDGAMQVAEKIRLDAANLRVAFNGGEWCGSISVGVALKTDAMHKEEELLKAADQSMYTAKQNGRNCVALSVQNNI